MKALALRFICAASVPLILFSCDGATGNSDRVPLGKSIAGKAGVGKSFVLPADAEPFIIDDSVAVGLLKIAGAENDCLVAYDKDRVMIFDSNGDLQSVIEKKGNGPQEYVQIFSVYADMARRQLYVTDVHKRNILRYTFNGEYVDVFHSDSCGNVMGTPGGDLIMCYAPYSETPFCFGIYDRDWNLLRESSLRKPVTESRIMNFEAAEAFNGECYFKKAHEDTLYSVTETVDRPVLIIDKGRYRAPDEYYKTDRPQGKFITGEKLSMAGWYLFLEFYLDGKMYRDVWNSQNCTLLFRSEISGGNDLPGFPVNVEGETVYCWPDYVAGENLYCVLLYNEAKKIFPDLPEDSNPIVLRLTLQH